MELRVDGQSKEGIRDLKESRRRIIALGYGVICHALFGYAVIVMAYSLFRGMDFTLLPESARPQGALRLLWNLLLILQFPIGYSLLLSKSGKRVLRFLSPISNDLQTTVFAIVSSFQLALLFSCWSPTGEVLLVAEGFLWELSAGIYLLGWILLGRAMWEADIRVQTGSLGWMAFYEGKKPSFRPFPTSGLHHLCRHPIYLSFLIIVFASPVWTLDRILLTPIWTAYLILAPALKERRYLKIYSESYRKYCDRTPYFFPTSDSFRKFLFGERGQTEDDLANV